MRIKFIDLTEKYDVMFPMLNKATLVLYETLVVGTVLEFSDGRATVLDTAAGAIDIEDFKFYKEYNKYLKGECI